MKTSAAIQEPAVSPALSLAPLLLAWALSGCTAVGDFCYEDSHCARGMRCSAHPGNRGVCTYPRGAPDGQAVMDARADRGPAEGGMVEAGKDAAAADSGPPDMRGDLPGIDLRADAWTPDASAPDAAAAGGDGPARTAPEGGPVDLGGGGD